MIMENHAIENLAQDLANDAKKNGIKRIVINSEGEAYSLSPYDFEMLKKRLHVLLPEVAVEYQLSK
jgi:diacylglycerol kinase family enzyme